MLLIEQQLFTIYCIVLTCAPHSTGFFQGRLFQKTNIWEYMKRQKMINRTVHFSYMFLTAKFSDGVLNTFVFVAVILWNVYDLHEQCGYLKSISLILSAPRDFLIHNIASIGIWPARSSGQQEMHRTDIIRMRAFLSLLLRSWTLARTLVTNLVLEHHWFLRCSLILPFHSKRFIWSKYWSIINSSIITRELWF